MLYLCQGLIPWANKHSVEIIQWGWDFSLWGRSGGGSLLICFHLGLCEAGDWVNFNILGQIFRRGLLFHICLVAAKFHMRALERSWGVLGGGFWALKAKDLKPPLILQKSNSALICCWKLLRNQAYWLQCWPISILPKCQGNHKLQRESRTWSILLSKEMETYVVKNRETSWKEEWKWLRRKVESKR